MNMKEAFKKYALLRWPLIELACGAVLIILSSFVALIAQARCPIMIAGGLTMVGFVITCVIAAIEDYEVHSRGY